MRKFGRSWAIEVNDRRFLRSTLRFRASYGRSGTATGEATVIMPPDELVWRLSTDAPQCRILAGYAGSEPVEVIAGAVMRGSVDPRLSGREPRITWSISSGAAALPRRVVALSLPEGATSTRALAELAQQIGVAVGAFQVGFDARYQRGLYVSGTVSSALDALCADADSRWTLDGGVLRVWPREGEAYQTATRWASSSGLLEAAITAGGQQVRARALLDAHLRRGDVIDLDAPAGSGLVTIDEVEHSGDTAGAAWYSEILGRWRA